MFCKKCGNKVKEEERFCSKCGGSTTLARDRIERTKLEGKTWNRLFVGCIILVVILVALVALSTIGFLLAPLF